MIKYAPLSGGFMISSIVGFFVSSIYIADFSLNWGFALAIVFVIMFIASIISMTKAPVGLGRMK
jgi:hypothetical protein